MTGVGLEAKSMYQRGTIPSLDGIRALAVLIVFIGHGYTVPSLFPGHVGVTVFFFLSGFLITTLLRREISDHGSIQLGNFYLRRVFRILPAAYAVVICSLALAATGLMGVRVHFTGALSEFLMFTNYYMVYADRENLPPLTSHLWSLAVEEHYYLVYPVAILIMVAFRWPLRRIGYALIALSACVLIWRLYLYSNGADFYRLYVSTDTRIDVLLYGSAMALLANPTFDDPIPGKQFINSWGPRVLAPLCTIGLVATTLVPNEYFRLVWADVIIAVCLGFIFWTVISRPGGMITRLLNSRMLIRIGVLSYSMYLFHRLVLGVIGEVVAAPILSDAVALLLTVALAQIVYLVVERPATRLRKKIEKSARWQRSAKVKFDVEQSTQGEDVNAIVRHPQ